MPKNEREWKYTLNEDAYEKLKSELYDNKNIKSVGILQWFINTEMEDGYERIRLEIFKEMDSYRHVWTYCKKVENKDESQNLEESSNPENREETELTLDMNYIVENEEDLKRERPEYMSEKAFIIINDVKNNLSKLSEHPAVFKIRYFLNAPGSDFEFILDELVPIDNYTYTDVSHIIEIEQKNKKVKYQRAKVINTSFIKGFLTEKEFIEHPSDLKESEKLKNKNIAIEAQKRACEIIPSAQKVIGYIENKMTGPVYVVAMQGNSIKFGSLNEEKNNKRENFIPKQVTEEKYDKYFNACAELDSIYLLVQDGFNIEKVYYFVFPDIEETNNVNFFYSDDKYPKIYKQLENYTKCFFEIECEAIPIEYSTKSRKMVNRTFGEVWNRLNEIKEKKEKESGRQIIMDITSGQKYPGIIASMYCMFNQLPFYYKQEHSQILIKFPAVPVNWDNVKIDGYNTFLKKITNDQNINYSEYLSLPQDVKNLFNFVENEETQNESELISLLTLKSIKEAYDSARKMPFGYGEDFIKHIEKEENEKWQEFIVEKISNKWSLQWIGDQIPETVEHSQRHSKRLMEFTNNLINIIGKETFLQGVPKELHDEFFFVLSVAMNIHDLGHTNSVWIFENGRKMFLDGLPGVVRDLHNELTIQMLDETKRGKEFNLLKGIEGKIKEPEKRRSIIKAIKLVCKYHRGYLRIEDKGGKNREFTKIFKLDITPLEKLLEKEFTEDNWKKMTKTAAQWLRFIDGTDVQSDRALSKEYTKTRSHRTAMESFNIGSELMYSQSEVIKELKLTFDMQQSLELLKKISDEIKSNTPKESEIEETGKALGKKGELIEKEVYKTLSKIVEAGTDTEYFSIPYELKQLAKFAFKIRQFPHFKKHASVKMVYPRFYREKHPEDVEKGKLYISYILEKEDDALKQTLIKDVEDEFNTALISSIPGKGIKNLKIEVEIQNQEGKN